MHKLLKFCYFLSIVSLISCGETKQKETPSPANVEPQASTSAQAVAEDPVILFFGNSLTAAYGLEKEQGFPALIQNKIDSLGWDYTVVNAGLSGETTSGGLNRLDWVLGQNVKVFVLELGANDGLRGIPLETSSKNLQKMITMVKEKDPDTKIVLAGMQIPPNMGPDYTNTFKGMYPELAARNNVALIPFLLENVAGEPERNLDDGIHPNVDGQKIVAENVWEILRPIIAP